MTNEIATLIAVSAIPWGLVGWLAVKLHDTERANERLWERKEYWRRIAEQFAMTDALLRQRDPLAQRGNVVQVDFRGRA